MELRHLRYFVAVAEELHFARAAERLHIAPPTLTVQIRQLEAHLGVALFQRTKRFVAITPAGEAFLPEARATLAQLERAEATARWAGRGELGRIEIGYVGSAAYAGVLQALLAAHRREHPQVDIHVHEKSMEDLPGLIEAGGIDLAFVRPPLRLPPGLRLHVLMRDRFCLALYADHALAGQAGTARAKDFAADTYILPEQEAGTMEFARRGRFAPRRGPVPGGLAAVLTEVSMGTGIAVVPHVLATTVRMPGVVFRPIAGAPIPSEIGVVVRRHERSPTTRKLIQRLATAAAAGAA